MDIMDIWRGLDYTFLISAIPRGGWTFANYSDEEISLEKLYEKIPRIFGSRSTIKYTLSDGVKKNFFVKNISRKDKRVKVYHLDYKSKLTLETWLEKRKNLVYTN